LKWKDEKIGSKIIPQFTEKFRLFRYENRFQILSKPSDENGIEITDFNFNFALID